MMQVHLFAGFDPVIQVHVLAALVALLLGPPTLLRRRRDLWHKALGYAWVTAMAATAVSSFWIFSIPFPVLGPFSPIHFLSVYVLFGLCIAIRAARAGRTEQHRSWMQGMYVGAVLGTGLFTLLPGRRMSQMIFPEAPWTGFLITAVTLGALLLMLRRRVRFPLHIRHRLR